MYSSIDDLVVYWYLGIVLTGFVINWILKKVKHLDTTRISFVLEEKEALKSLENYTLNFNDDEMILAKPSRVSLLNKIIIVLLSFLFVFLPLYELIETLRPQDYFFGWSCFS